MIIGSGASLACSGHWFEMSLGIQNLRSYLDKSRRIH